METQEQNPMELFGLDKELVEIKSEHVQVVTDFMEQHRVRGLVVKQEAEIVAGDIKDDDPDSVQTAIDWCRNTNTEKTMIVKGPLGFWRNLFHKAHQATKDIEKQLVEPYEQSVSFVDVKIRDWQRRDLMRRQEIERKAAEANRKREEELRLQAAQKLAEAGHKEAADQVLERPMVIQAPTVAAPKFTGQVQRKPKIVARCDTPEDKWQFIKHVVERGPSYASLLDINFKKCEEMAKSLDGNLVLPGVRFELQEAEGSYRQRAQA